MSICPDARICTNLLSTLVGKTWLAYSYHCSSISYSTFFFSYLDPLTNDGVPAAISNFPILESPPGIEDIHPEPTRKQ